MSAAAQPIDPQMGGGRRGTALGRFMKGRIGQVAQSLIGPALLLGTWQSLVSFGSVNPAFLPPPAQVASRLIRVAESGVLWDHLVASLIRVGGGFIIAIFLGLTLGIAMGMMPSVRIVFSPIIEIIRPISPIAWIPLAILWFGLGNGVAWFVIFLAAFFPIVTNMYKGVTSVSTNHLRAAACCGIRGWRLVTQIVIPSAFPDAMAGMRIGFGISWMAVIAAELVAAQSGLGYLIWSSRQMFDAPGVLVGMVTIGAVGLVLNHGMLTLERRVTTWRSTGTA